MTYKVSDLPAVRARAAMATAEEAAPPVAAAPTEVPTNAPQEWIRSKPDLAFNNGHYYVVEREK